MRLQRFLRPSTHTHTHTHTHTRARVRARAFTHTLTRSVLAVIQARNFPAVDQARNVPPVVQARNLPAVVQAAARRLCGFGHGVIVDHNTKKNVQHVAEAGMAVTLFIPPGWGLKNSFDEALRGACC